MLKAWHALETGYLRLVEPLIAYLVRRRVNPNVITTIGTACMITSAVIFASGRISIAGWVLGLTAIFDVLDGNVARRSGRETKFGAFYDSSLDRISDGAVLAGLTVFYAGDTARHSVGMVVVCLAAIIGSFLTSYTRARAEGLGIYAKVGLIQRPERVVLLAAPQAFFGLAFDGWVLKAIITLLAVTSWITVVQRMLFVHRATAARATTARAAVSLSATSPASSPAPAQGSSSAPAVAQAVAPAVSAADGVPAAVHARSPR